MNKTTCGVRIGVVPALFLALTVQTGSILAGGLPGQYVLSNGWRALLVEHSPLSNPAELTSENYASLRMSISTVLNNFRTFEAGVTLPLGLHQTAAFTLVGQGTNSFPQTTIENGTITLTGRKAGDSHTMLMLSYAINPWRALSLGINANLVYQSLYGQQNNAAPGVDAAIAWRIVRHPVVGEHTAGITLQNAVAPTFSTGESYSRSLDISLNSSYLESRVGTFFEFSLLDLFAPGTEFSNQSTSLEWSFLSRLDFWVLRMGRLFGVLGIGQQGWQYGGVGLGVNVPSLNNGRDMEFLYQYLSLTDANPSHSAFARSQIGKHREEIYARKMAQRYNMAPNDLYTKALDLYSRKEYWDAFFLFSKLSNEYPDFFKNDWVAYYRGSCLEEMDMRSAAKHTYAAAKDLFSRSDILGPALLGIMRIEYRNDDKGAIETLMQELNQPLIADSIKFHGWYLAGQNALSTGENRKAQTLLEKIPSHHPDYVFARHSLAVLSLRANDYDAAIDHLQECVQARSVTTPAQKDIINRSYLFLGLLFYEQSREIESGLAKAVTALRQIPPQSSFSENALLGLGWCALKARQWTDCIAAGKQLRAISSSPVNQSEGLLLEAYAHIISGNRGAAENLLREATATIEAYSGPDKTKEQDNQLSLTASRQEYAAVATATLDLSERGQNSSALASIDSIETIQKSTHGRLRGLIAQTDAFQRESFFARSYEQVKEDIAYAYAQILTQKTSQKAYDTQQQIRQESKEIDSEIQKLQEQLEKIENSNTQEQ